MVKEDSYVLGKEVIQQNTEFHTLDSKTHELFRVEAHQKQYAHWKKLQELMFHKTQLIFHM